MRLTSLNSRSNLPVIIHIYDLHPQNEYLYPLGLGFYHSGIVIDNQEYTYSQSGIFNHTPKDLNGAEAIFREAIVLGTFNGTISDVNMIISELRQYFQGTEYHVMKKNCNCFSASFVQKLLGKEIPGYVNRMANIGSYFSCLVDPMIEGANQQKNSNSGYRPVNTTSGNPPKAYSPFSGSGRRLDS